MPINDKDIHINPFLAFTCSIGFAQTKEAVDSLQHQLAIAKDDTSRINAQIALCLLYHFGKYRFFNYIR